MSTFRARLALVAPVAALVLVAPACKQSKPEEKEMKDLAQKSAELDKLSQQARAQGQGQAEKLKAAGVTDIKPGEAMQLTEEQRKALEERAKAEKNTSYQALLQEVLDKDKEIKKLNEEITKLKVQMPPADVATANDNHYALALKFLTRKMKVPEAEAKALIARVSLQEKLAPGFRVYHFYKKGVYGTWVTQGDAKVTPQELQRAEREKIEGERDTAVAQNEKLQEEVTDLVSEKRRIEEEIAGLRTEKTKITEELSAMTATSEAQKAKLNSMHYLVGETKDLQKREIIIVPVFAKDRHGKKWADGLFTKSLDLRSSDTLAITAAEVGVKKIGKVSVIPGSLVKDEHYTVTISPDKATATIKLLVKDRFLNEKVVFAVAD